MATVARSLTRTAIRAGARRTFTVAAARPAYRQYQKQGSRPYSDSAPKPSSSSSSDGAPRPSSSSSQAWIYALAAAGVAGAAYFYLGPGSSGQVKAKVFKPTKEDYQKVYDEIATRLEEKDDYDDGSYGPVLLRLAWHASGTYDKETGTGGSNGATMRFAPESDHGANAGLKAARDFLEPVKVKYPWITYSDLWILGGVCAIQEAQGPVIPYRPGRSDRDVAYCTPDGRLPDAAQGQRHLRDIFHRMGFNDQEIVALAGAHALGRCHTDRSGYSGPWTFSPTVLTNDFFRLLVEEKWQLKKWDGPAQYEDKKTQSLMMLPADMALVQDKSFKQYVEKYAKDNDAFFEDFAAVIVKLFELGVPFADSTERWVFKASS